MAASDVREEILRQVFRDAESYGDGVTLGDGVWVSLHTDWPTADNSSTGEPDGSNEVSGGSYGRQNVSWNQPADGSGSSDSDIDNSNQLDFTDMPAETVSHVAVWDAETAGNVLWVGSLDTARTLEAGDTLRIEAGDLTATVD